LGTRTVVFKVFHFLHNSRIFERQKGYSDHNETPAKYPSEVDAFRKSAFHDDEKKTRSLLDFFLELKVDLFDVSSLCLEIDFIFQISAVSHGSLQQLIGAEGNNDPSLYNILKFSEFFGDGLKLFLILLALEAEIVSNSVFTFRPDLSIEMSLSHKTISGYLMVKFNFEVFLPKVQISKSSR
jgi:hypothetical protein